MNNIRNFDKSDFDMIKAWWKAAKEPHPPIEYLPEDTTFIYSINNVPVYSITVYLTNCKEIAFLENFIKNPEYKNDSTHSQNFINYIYDFVRDSGYKKVIGMTDKEKLVKRYKELGMKKISENFYSLVRELR